MTWEQIVKANEAIVPMEISRKDKKTGKEIKKDYAEVNQRVKVFRMLYPEGVICTEMVQCDENMCVFRALVSNEDGKLLATGTAFEMRKSSFINETSYIENCETSAIGRALGMCGIGIDTSIASFEEVANAQKQQAKPEPLQTFSDAPQKATRAEMLKVCKEHYPDGSKAQDSLLQCWQIDSIEKASDTQLMVVYGKYAK